MLYMIIEHFRDGDPLPVYRRLRDEGRLVPEGLRYVASEIILDQWNPSKTKWRFETHCYGPRGCPRYKAGPPRRVPGRKPGMVWIDDDVEREERDGG